MKKPKIGDIVHYTQGLFTMPAIVQAVFSDEDIRLFIMHEKYTEIRDAAYSKEKEHEHWSWPEEEKLCQSHEYDSEWNCKNCKISRETIEEKLMTKYQQSCKHDFREFYNSSSDKFIEKCWNCFVKKESVSKYSFTSPHLLPSPHHLQLATN